MPLSAEETKENQDLLEMMTSTSGGALKTTDPPRLEDVIHKGDDAWPQPIVAKVYQDAGVVVIYDATTGEPSYTSRNMLPAQLKKIDNNGKKMFLAHKPATTHKKKVGLKCWLHPDDPNRQKYDDWGLTVCTKAGLLNAFHRDRHVKIRHSSEYEMIMQDRAQIKEEQDRELNIAIKEGLANAAGLQGEAETPHRGRPRKDQAAG